MTLLILGLFSPLLRLLATHFPQLCLVEDWMYEDSENEMACARANNKSKTWCTRQSVSQGTFGFTDLTNE